jgi:hypothetical protein
LAIAEMRSRRQGRAASRFPRPPSVALNVILATDQKTRSQLQHFQAKWTPLRVKKMRQSKNIEPSSDSIGMAMAPEPFLLRVLRQIVSPRKADVAAPNETFD